MFAYYCERKPDYYFVSEYKNQYMYVPQLNEKLSFNVLAVPLCQLAELKKEGVRLLSVPAIVVSHKKEFGFLYFLAQRFYYSRSFAGMRRRRISTLGRIYYLFFSPFLPFLMIGRIAGNVLRKKRHRKVFLIALPLLVIFMVSYAFGEFVGYLIGSGGSLLKVE